MVRKSVIVIFVATFSAAVLAAVIGTHGAPARSEATADVPVLTDDTIVIYGERAKVSTETPEQVAITR